MWSIIRDSFLSSLAAVGSISLFDSVPVFNVSEATIDSLQEAFFLHGVPCRDIISAFLSQIETYNPSINAIIRLNPHALSEADKIDTAYAAGGISGFLACVPVLLKDNFDVAGFNTTGGCRALADIEPSADAPTVKALRDEKAIILGKTNMHELALEGLSVSSLGGQTLNPYDRTRTPGGSSGGTGAALAAAFSVLGTGTDTMNSLRNPASANSLYSIRPTRGLLSRAGVMPVSYTQDAVGPIARALKDVAMALMVMSGVGYDPADNTTALRPMANPGLDYVRAVYNPRNITDLRLGVPEGLFNRTPSDETTPVNDVMDSLMSKLEAAGATVIPIADPIYNPRAILSSLDMQAYEFQESMDSYLRAHNTNFASIYRNAGKEEGSTDDSYMVIPNQYHLVNTALHSSPANTTYATRHLQIQDFSLAVKRTFAAHSLDALVYPQQQNLVVKLSSPSQSGRNGIIAAVTGSPVLTVPVGFSPPSEDAPVGVPIGMEILGREWGEENLLKIAAAIEAVVGKVQQPPLLDTLWKSEKVIRWKWRQGVPQIVPDISGIADTYPIGRLE